MSIADVTVSITDNDTAGVTIDLVDGVAVTEGGTTGDSYTIVLDSEPTANVIVTVDPDTQTRVNGYSAGVSVDLTFIPSNWDTPQTVNVAAYNDAVIEGTHYSDITHIAGGDGYTGVSIENVIVTISDNDSLLSPSSTITTHYPANIAPERSPGNYRGRPRQLPVQTTVPPTPQAGPAPEP